MAPAKLALENPSNFAQVERFMQGKEYKKLGNNTEIIRDEQNFKLVFLVKLHGSIIASYSETHCELTLAGYNTVTTRGRLNKLVPAGRFFQKNHDPFFSLAGEDHALNSSDTVKLPWDLSEVDINGRKHWTRDKTQYIL